MNDIPIPSNNLSLLKNWIVCLSVVKFDLDEGQIIESIFPSDSLSQKEQKLLSLLSFPDSNSLSSAEGTLTYAIRLKRERNIKDAVPGALFSFGYVYFLQKKDEKISRGYFQKSIVLVSNYPLIDFFFGIIQSIGAMYFKNEDKAFIEVRINKYFYV